jgi:hypothetical protein
MTPIWAPYGRAYTFRAPIVGNSTTNFSNTWTATAGTVKIVLDGGAGANVATLPNIVSSQYVYNWYLSASEMQADEVIIQTVDRTNVSDQMFRIITLPDGALRSRNVGSNAAANATTVVLDSGANGATDNIYNGAIFTIIAGDGTGQNRVVTAYNSSTKTVTIDTGLVYAVTASGNNASTYALYPQAIIGLSNANVQTSVVAALTTYGTSTLTSANVQTAVTTSLTSYGTSTLTSANVTAAVPTVSQISTQILDTEVIETGYSVRKGLRAMSAMLAGYRSGISTTSEVYYSLGNSSVARVTFAFPSSTNANSTSVTLSL